MSRSEFSKLVKAFHAALELDEQGRDALLAEIAVEDSAMALRLRAMLDADADTKDRVRASVTRAAHELPVELPANIGPFEVIQQLGCGGMGAVYLCRRNHGDFEQTLAVKRLPFAADNPLVRERLKLERRVLAGLHHPHIAQMLDGGEDADGTPWVAMEFVDGLPIHQHTPDRRARIRLFLQLCEAVQFAHRNMVVHRDLKPDNVLVDRHGQVKLLDFGIAKLLGDGNGTSASAALTVAGTMTPHYASPEQVRGEPASLASDIYSLGVMLYQLLTDQRPYELNTSRPSEIERIVCEKQPAPPSQLLGRLGGRARDLDAIVLKAMHKLPERRYGSAEQLAEDLERWLQDRPVQARPDSASYRLQSFLRRHPLGAGTSVLLVLLLAGFAVVMAVQAERIAGERDLATREARVAQETADFLIEIFGASDPRVSDPADVSARDLLEIAAGRLPEALDSDPLARARLIHTIGLAFANMGDERGTALLADALALRERHAGLDSAEVADSLNRLGNIHRQFGRLGEAEAMLVRALDWRLRNGPVDYDLADSHNNVGLLQTELGYHSEAEATLRQAIALHRQVAGSETDSVVSPLHNLAIVLRAQGRFDEARDAALESVQRKRSAGTSIASLANTLAVLARIELQLGQLDEALAHSSESLALRREVYGDDNRMITSGLVTHAATLAALDRPDEARALFEQALEVSRRNDEMDTLRTAHMHLGYGRFLHNQGELEAAHNHITRAHEIAVNRYPEGSPALERFQDALDEMEHSTGG